MSAEVIEFETVTTEEELTTHQNLQEWLVSLEYIKRDAIESGHDEIAYFGEMMLMEIRNSITSNRK